MYFSKSLLLSFLLFLITDITKANEGLWLPNLLKEINEAEMISLGMEISADDIYNINNSSMKDAVVLFGSGCTAGIISKNGLILTNHHCAYGTIQARSSAENDYLDNGFWANDYKEELNNPGLESRILVYMEDVTNEVLKNKTSNVDIENTISLIIERVTKDNHYEAKVTPTFNGNQYLLSVYEVFQDVRLVGAPPSYIGRFGKDTDNWIWPRHNADFTWFRIYADTNNLPASYNKNNVPYKPKYHFNISIDGVEEGDFTFVYGYPAKTNQFATSFKIKHLINQKYPLAIEMRGARMNIIQKSTDNSTEIKLKYSSKLASISNFWKKMQGEILGVNSINGINIKQQFESDFLKWVNNDHNRKKKYGNLINDFENIYKDLKPLSLAYTVFYEGGYAIEMVRFAMGFFNLYELSQIKNIDKNIINIEFERLIDFTNNFYKNYSPSIDKEIIAKILPFYQSVDDDRFKLNILKEIEKKHNNDFYKYSEFIFNKSLFAKKDELLNILEKNNSKNLAKKLSKDPGFNLSIDIYNNYIYIESLISKLDSKLDSLHKLYVEGIMEMQKQKKYYPDANKTLRISYGNVSSYNPYDAINHKYYTTINGILEKINYEKDDYLISEHFYEFLKKRDFENYVHADGSMRTAFIATNHTTGGNSGSPVLNKDGYLVGLNFDRVWEGTMSDLFFSDNLCRNISVDIRYILLITDKYAKAKNIIDELNIIKTK